MRITSILLNEVHEKFFEDKCINVSGYIRKLIESDPEYIKWKQNNGGFIHGQ